MAVAIDRHPQREQIIRDILANKPYRDISATLQPPIHYTTLQRYARSVIRPTMEGAQVLAKSLQALAKNGMETPVALDPQHATQVALAADPFIARVEQLRAERAEVKQQARSGGDLRTFAALDRNDLTELELHARLANRLDSAPAGTSSTFVLIPIAIPTPMQALPMPEAQDVEWSEVKDGE